MLKLSLRFAFVAAIAAALIGCVENGPADSDTKDCDASIDGNVPTPDAGVDAPTLNHVPVVRITAPAPNTTFDVGSSLVIMIDAYDSDVVGGTVQRLEVYYQRTTGNDLMKHWIGDATRLSGTSYQLIWSTVGKPADTYRLVAVAKGDKWSQEGDLDITGSLEVPIVLTSEDIPPTTITSFTVNPDTLTGPGSAMATWASNATSCQLDRLVGTTYESLFVGLAPNSSANLGVVSSTTFRLTCTGPGGSDSEFDTVTVTGSPAPTIGLFTATPSTCTGPCTSNLGWSGVTNASGCSINTTGGSGLSGTSGNLNVSVTATTTYVLTCTGPGGSVSANATVTVSSIPPTTITSFTVTPTNCTTTCTVNLTWASNGTSCTASNGWTGTKAATGSQNVTVASTTTFTLTCTGPGGLSAPSSQTVAVASETPMAFDVICPAGTTVTNLWFWPLVGSGHLASIPVTSAGGIWHSPVGAGSATVEYPNRWANWLAGDATFHANAPTSCYAVLSFYGDGRHSAPYHLAAGEAGWGWAWNDQSRAH